MSIVRNGYGTYAGQARVSRPDENANKFADGFWAWIADLFPISFALDFKVAAEEIATASISPISVPKGRIVTLSGIEADGILVDEIDGCMGHHLIFLRDAVALKMCRARVFFFI